MPKGPSKENANLSPLLHFYFAVDFGTGVDMPFHEVSGLDVETQVIDYRSGNSPVFSTIKMPGISKYGNVTLKKGMVTKDNPFWNWCSAIEMNTIKRSTVIIKLFDQTGTPTMTWTLQNAFPTKITASDMKSDDNEVGIESLEIAHEGVIIRNI